MSFKVFSQVSNSNSQTNKLKHKLKSNKIIKICILRSFQYGAHCTMFDITKKVNNKDFKPWFMGID